MMVMVREEDVNTFTTYNISLVLYIFLCYNI